MVVLASRRTGVAPLVITGAIVVLVDEFAEPAANGGPEDDSNGRKLGMARNSLVLLTVAIVDDAYGGSGVPSAIDCILLDVGVT